MQIILDIFRFGSTPWDCQLQRGPRFLHAHSWPFWKAKTRSYASSTWSSQAVPNPCNVNVAEPQQSIGTFSQLQFRAGLQLLPLYQQPLFRTIIISIKTQKTFRMPQGCWYLHNALSLQHRMPENYLHFTMMGFEPVQPEQRVFFVIRQHISLFFPCRILFSKCSEWCVLLKKLGSSGNQTLGTYLSQANCDHHWSSIFVDMEGKNKNKNLKPDIFHCSQTFEGFLSKTEK